MKTSALPPSELPPRWTLPDPSSQTDMVSVKNGLSGVSPPSKYLVQAEPFWMNRSSLPPPENPPVVLSTIRPSGWRSRASILPEPRPRLAAVRNIVNVPAPRRPCASGEAVGVNFTISPGSAVPAPGTAVEAAKLIQIGLHPLHPAAFGSM